MPILKTVKVNQNVSWALWKIEEEVHELSQRYAPNANEQRELDSIKVEVRKKESLAARLALNHLLKQYQLDPREVYKDEHGKPHVDHDGIEMSISHANGYGAAAINLIGPVGIDIEHPRPQIVKIARKFLHESEKSWAANDVEKLTMIWSAKEALYKLHGRTQLVFSEQLIVNSSIGKILEGDTITPFKLSYESTPYIMSCLAY